MIRKPVFPEHALCAGHCLWVLLPNPRDIPVGDVCSYPPFTDEQTEACRGPGCHSADSGPEDADEGLSVCLSSPYISVAPPTSNKSVLPSPSPENMASFHPPVFPASLWQESKVWPGHLLNY